MAVQLQTRSITPEEYLTRERAAATKSEYYQGEMIPMTGASRRHNLIVMAIATSFYDQLRKRDCEVYASDMRVKVRATGLHTYPDVIIACGVLEFDDDQLDTLLTPTVIVEVLSKSTKAYDRGDKFEHYRTIDSLRASNLMLQTTVDPTKPITVELPEPIYQLLAKVAESTDQSLEQLAMQSITGNLPPTIENAPADIQSDLLALQIGTVDELLQIAQSKVPIEQQERHYELLEKNSAGTITPGERKELTDLRHAVDRLMLRKAYAWAVLRWRGHRVPTLDELPLP